MDSKGEVAPAPSQAAKALDEGYTQTYLIMAKPSQLPNADSKSDLEADEVFFRCGNWCYKGLIQFGSLRVGVEDLPVLIPTLQRQQGSLRYYCTSKNVPADSLYAKPLLFLEEASEFVAKQILNESIDKELRKMAAIFPWIDDDSASTYFELTLGDLPPYMKHIGLIANKTYTRGLIIISIFFECTVYFLIQGGDGDQPLLDVRFPDVSRHGQGVHLNSFNDPSKCWRKLTLWHVLNAEGMQLKKEVPKIKTLNVSTKNYEQTYCILKSAWDSSSPTLSVHHDVLFRFGSWCYSGRVQLTPSLSLTDIPYVIPALRMQQSRLDYLCDVNTVPVTSPFASALEYMQWITPMLEDRIERSEETLTALISRLTAMGLGESVSRWLEGDSADSFFEFKVAPDLALSEKFKNVELVVSKCYHASGIITITIIFQFTVYVTVLESLGENPLLDSRFPDVSGKGRGYQLEAFPEGLPSWPTLRKVSIWQTVGALEKEFRDKAAQLADAKKTNQVESKSSVSRNGAAFHSDDEDEVTMLSYGLGEEDDDDCPSGAQRDCDSKGDEAERAEEERAAEVKQSSNTERIAHNTISSSAPVIEADSKPATLSETGQKESPSKLLSQESTRPGRLQALPHHLPKMDSLSKKLVEIRNTMGEEGLKAPWDSRGKPLGGITTTTSVARK